MHKKAGELPTVFKLNDPGASGHISHKPNLSHNLKPCGAHLEDKTKSMFVLDKLAYVGPQDDKMYNMRW